MRLDQNPFFRKAIIPWNESNLSCWIFVTICAFALIFSMIGIKVALVNQAFTGFVWLPSFMAFLSLFVMIKILVKLITQFPHLKNSKDALKFQLLPKYQFMNGMPHYEDMIEVASGDDLLEKIKDNDKVLFTQKLENGSTLIGIKLSKRTRTFTRRIGRNNAAMLPYPILIENGKAKILDPKYYIAYMYPLLQMSEFMTIASIPDAMIKDCEKVFKKRKKKKKKKK